MKRAQIRAYNIAKIVDSYSNPNNSEILGKHLETLVKQELRAQRFKIIDQNTNEYRGKKWTKTNQDLDFIAEHETGKLTIGVEVKNTLEVMPVQEIDDKIDICQHLEITPVFAVRWVKPYVYPISLRGGFSWMFKIQMYPLGHDRFVKNIFEKLSVLKRLTQGGGHCNFQ